MMGEPEGPVTDPDDPRLADEDSEGPVTRPADPRLAEEDSEGPVTEPDDSRLDPEAASDEPSGHEPADKPAADQPPADAPAGDEREADGPAADGPAADESADADSAAPGLTDVTVNVDPDDGADHHPHSIQVASDATITLTWTGNENTTGEEIDGLGSFSASGSAPLQTQDASYSLLPAGEGGVSGRAWPLDVHVYYPGDV